MSMFRSYVVIALFSLSMVVAAACGYSSSSMSPAAPSSLSSTGSTINGLINGGNAQTVGSPLRVTTAAVTGAGMTVTAEGTGKSTTADSVGRFTLTQLPEGKLQLRFTGSGADARLPISLGRSEMVNIAVRVEGSRATVESEQRSSADNQRDLEGAVAGLSGTCPSITFSIRGTMVVTNSSTVFKEVACGKLRNNSTVEVKGQRRADGVLVASQVEADDEED